MKIKEFEIENLYGKYSFKSLLDEKVNIIVGNNGTFKTTLLRIINGISSFVLPKDSFILTLLRSKKIIICLLNITNTIQPFLN